MVKLGCGVNETDCSIAGLSSFGTDLGAFLTNLTPGIVGLVFVLAIVGGVIGIIVALIFVVRKAVMKKS